MSVMGGMSPTKTTRRHFIAIAAAAAAFPGTKSTLAASGPAFGPAGVGWSGRALGAEASIILHHPDRRAAEAAVAASVAEIRRLERIFSLFRADAAIIRLNREGRLDPAPSEMIELLALARWLSDMSDGAFDITVQPLWQAFAQGGDCRARVEKVQHLVDWRGVIVEKNAVRFARRGMAITLNGIAQGYITDRVAGLLSQRGFANALVHMGEYRGLGRREDGMPWQIGIGDPISGDIVERLDLTDRALATSSPLGTGLACTDTPNAHHLFDPKTGRLAGYWASVSVVAERAAIADGLSTAVAITPPEKAIALLEGGGADLAMLQEPTGRKKLFQSEKS